MKNVICWTYVKGHTEEITFKNNPKGTGICFYRFKKGGKGWQQSFKQSPARGEGNGSQGNWNQRFPRGSYRSFWR